LLIVGMFMSVRDLSIVTVATSWSSQDSGCPPEASMDQHRVRITEGVMVPVSDGGRPVPGSKRLYI